MTTKELLAGLQEIRSRKNRVDTLSKAKSMSYESYLRSHGFENTEEELKQLNEPKLFLKPLRSFKRKWHVIFLVFSILDGIAVPILALSLLLDILGVETSSSPRTEGTIPTGIAVTVFTLLSFVGLLLAFILLNKKALKDAKAKCDADHKIAKEEFEKNLEEYNRHKSELEEKLSIYKEAEKSEKDKYKTYLLEAQKEWEMAECELNECISSIFPGEVIVLDDLPELIEYVKTGRASTLHEAKTLHTQLIIESQRMEAEAENAARIERSNQQIAEAITKAEANRQRNGSWQCATCANSGHCHYRRSDGHCGGFRPAR